MSISILVKSCESGLPLIPKGSFGRVPQSPGGGCCSASSIPRLLTPPPFLSYVKASAWEAFRELASCCPCIQETGLLVPFYSACRQLNGRESYVVSASFLSPLLLSHISFQWLDVYESSFPSDAYFVCLVLLVNTETHPPSHPPELGLLATGAKNKRDSEAFKQILTFKQNLSSFILRIQKQEPGNYFSHT